MDRWLHVLVAVGLAAAALGLWAWFLEHYAPGSYVPAEGPKPLPTWSWAVWLGPYPLVVAAAVSPNEGWNWLVVGLAAGLLQFGRDGVLRWHNRGLTPPPPAPRIGRSLPPAGWYADPVVPGSERWWTGEAWGTQVRPRHDAYAAPEQTA